MLRPRRFSFSVWCGGMRVHSFVPRRVATSGKKRKKKSKKSKASSRSSSCERESSREHAKRAVVEKMREKARFEAERSKLRGGSV